MDAKTTSAMTAACVGFALCGGCASPNVEVAAPVRAPASGVASSPEIHRTRDELRRESHQRTRERLERLRVETRRAAERLELEGTAEERARFARELHDIEHDRRLLGAALLQVERGPVEEWDEAYLGLSEMAEVLGSVGTETVAEIERTLEAGGPSRTASVEGGLDGIDLCSLLKVEGARADFRRDGGQLILELTSTNPPAARSLRDRALALWRPLPTTPEDRAAGEPVSGAPTRVSVPTALEETGAGVRFVFTPSPEQASRLGAELEGWIERAEAQSC